MVSVSSKYMRLVITALAATMGSLAASAQPDWKDCATAQQYRVQHGSEWQERSGAVKLCYDTHAFTLTTPAKRWYTGIVRYTQHLEGGYLVEQFFSEENDKYPGSELQFRIVRRTPAIITITNLGTGEVWKMESGSLPEVKVTAPH